MIADYTPFKVGIIAHTAETTAAVQEFVPDAERQLENVVLIEGHQVPGCDIFLGTGLSCHQGYAVVFSMPGCGTTLSSFECGSLSKVIVNIQALIISGIISDAYVMGMDLDYSPSLASGDSNKRALMDRDLDVLESMLISADPRQSMDDDSPAVRLSDYLVSVNGDWIDVTKNSIDTIVATILQNCPYVAKCDTAMAVIQIRKDLVNSLRKIFV